MIPPASVRGRLSWLGHDVTVAVPHPMWFVWLKDFTGLTVRAEDADLPLGSAAPPVLSVIDDRHVLVDGCDLRSFAGIDHLKTWLFLTVSDVMIERGGFTAFHAAAFVLDERAVLVSGRPWAGKSSWAFAAVSRGLRVLGDDQVLVDATAGLVYGLPRPMKRRIVAGVAAPAVSRAQVRARLDDEEVVLEPRRPAGLTRVDRGYAVSAVVHLSRHEGPGVVLVPLAPSQSVRMILDQIRGRPRGYLKQVAAAARMLSRVKNIGLSVGDGEIARGLDTFMEWERTNGGEANVRPASD